MAKLFTYRLTATHSIEFQKRNGFTYISISNEIGSTANGTMLGTMTASVMIDGVLADVASIAANIERGQPATIIENAAEFDSILITAPAGCNMNIFASTI